jgi:hypothetical protein
MVRDSVEEAQLATAVPPPVVQGVYATPPRMTPSKTNDGEQVAVIK